MASVGDIILTARELFPDPAGTVGTPATPTLTASLTGGSLATGTIYVQVTETNAWGETLASAEVSVAVTGPNASVAVAVVMLPGATAGRAYYGNVTGGETQYIALDSTGAGTITSLTAGTGQGIPLNNTCFQPDSDGGAIGAYTLYRWLNDGLKEASRIAGGILDMVGIQAIVGQAEYPLTTGNWINISDAWYDGWLLWSAKRRDIWRHTHISAITNYVGVEQIGNQYVFRFYPSPNRAGATGTLNGALSATATTIPLNTAIPTGLISPGMIRIDNEQITFTTTSGNSLIGAVRGWGGTVAASHSNNAAVTELNITLAGYRQPVIHNVGDSALTLRMPSTWETPIADYLLYRFKQFEQATSEALEQYNSFNAQMKQIAQDSRPPKGPVEIGSSQHMLLYPGRIWGLIVN